MNEINKSLEHLAQAIRNLDSRLRSLANREPIIQSWQVPSLINSWANTGGAYATAGYFKHNGVVHLRGRVTGGAFASDIFVLPENYRPEATISYNVPTGAVVDIEADGSVRAISGSSYVALDSVTFRSYS